MHCSRFLAIAQAFSLCVKLEFSLPDRSGILDHSMSTNSSSLWHSSLKSLQRELASSLTHVHFLKRLNLIVVLMVQAWRRLCSARMPRGVNGWSRLLSAVSSGSTTPSSATSARHGAGSRQVREPVSHLFSFVLAEGSAPDSALIWAPLHQDYELIHKARATLKFISNQ